MERWDTERNDQRCLTCESHVTPEFRRAYGDRDDRVHRCPTCDTAIRLSEGSAAGKDISTRDPLEYPGRFDVSLDELPPRVRSLVDARSVATDGGEDQ